MGLANGKIAVILEGGYCLKSLAEGAALTLRTLLGDPCPSIEALPAPSSESVKISILTTYNKMYFFMGTQKLNVNFLEWVKLF